MKNYDVLINPMATEKSVRLMETENKLTFVVAKSATKPMIKKAIESMFNIKVKEINTHIRGGKKIAFISLRSTPICSRAKLILFALTPTSIKIPPEPLPIYVQFPLLPLKSVQKRAIGFLLYNTKLGLPMGNPEDL